MTYYLGLVWVIFSAVNGWALPARRWLVVVLAAAGHGWGGVGGAAFSLANVSLLLLFSPYYNQVNIVRGHKTGSNKSGVEVYLRKK